MSQRVELPLIRGDGRRIINPTPEELDASLWGEGRETEGGVAEDWRFRREGVPGGCVWMLSPV